MLPSLPRRLAIQGFVGLDEATAARLDPWLRLTPIACTSLTSIGTVLASSPLLMTLAAVTALGAVFRVHPFDLVFNLGIRHLVNMPPLPQNGPPRRFACGLASVWLVATAVAFEAGVGPAGYVLGGSLTAAVALVSFAQICIPSILFSTLFAREAFKV